MAKKKTTYICAEELGGCGKTFTRELAVCPRCDEFGTMKLDETPEGGSQAGLKTSGASAPTKPAKKLKDLHSESFERFTTGIGELDRVLGGGFVTGSVVLLGGQPGSGKALKDDTLIPMARGGFQYLRDIVPGDELIDTDGKRTRVVNVIHPTVERAFRLTFHNGSTIDACEDHIWNIIAPEDVDAKWYVDKRVEQHTTLALFENFATYRTTDQYPTLEHMAVQTYPQRELKVSPYAVGYLLGGGAQQYNQEHGDLHTVLHDYAQYDVTLELNTIPAPYLYSSLEQRRALLQGFLNGTNTDMSGDKTSVHLPFREVLQDFCTLLDTVGIPYSVKQEHGGVRVDIYDRHMSSSLPYIQSIEEIPVQVDDTYMCLMVDAPSQTYRVGEHFLVTHNSTLSMSIAEKFAEQDFTVLYASGEESEPQIALRAKRMNVDSDNIHIVNETNLEAILGQIDHIQPDFVIVDSLQTIASSEVSGSVGSIAQSSECAHALTRTAKNRGITMLLISQVTKS